MNQLQQLLRQGQSIWYDFISRELIATGEMARLVGLGIRGMTSNPTIFEKAVAGGDSYDEQIRTLALGGASTEEIANALFIQDIRSACDLLRPVHDESDGGDGFVSLEVNPRLAEQTEATISEAHALWNAIDRPNLMIKIPATPQGLPAVRRCLADGINVNITLMFSLEQYQAVAGAYIEALEERLAAGLPIDRIASVASVFVSRIDTLIDSLLEKIGSDEALALRGKGALANSKLVYAEYQRLFGNERWEPLASAGARPQRPLWASTSTKNPNYPRLLYVTPLVGPDTVNTVPPDTLEAILAEGPFEKATVTEGAEEAAMTMRDLALVGINIDAVMEQLLTEGVAKFETSFDGLFQKIEAKKKDLVQRAEAEGRG